MKMSNEDLIEKIQELCNDNAKQQMSKEDLQCNLEDGFGGNGDDAFYAGCTEGAADFAKTLILMINDHC